MSACRTPQRTAIELDRHVRLAGRPDPELQTGTDMGAGPLGADAFELLLNSLKHTGTLIETPSRPGDRRPEAVNDIETPRAK